MVNYRIVDAVPKAVQAALRTYDPLTQQLLYQRGVLTQEDAQAFLDPSYDETLHDPFLLHDMDTAVQRILDAIARNERIAIYSDYDCDGIPGAVIMHDLFTTIGYDNFTTYIPHRHYEGFGFNSGAVAKLCDDGVKLIITIDCGTADHEAVAYARERDIDVIITDHHEPKETLPEATAVVNPKVGDTYPFGGLCGAAVIFKLTQALLQKGTAAGCFTCKAGWEKWWLDMVGIATIADMVPLTGENRTLARYGLQVLRKSRRPGLQHLLRKQRVQQRYLSEDDIGFTIGPRINAASRMDDPEHAFHMLTTLNEGEAGAHVAHLEKLNNERRGLVAAMTKQVNKRLRTSEELPDVLVLGDPNWRPSLVGLLAGKLAEAHGRPVFVWGKDGNGVLKGSCRSEGKTSVISLMDVISQHFIEYGGHHMSGGFSVKEAHIHTLAQTLNDAFVQLGSKAFVQQELSVDALITLDAIDHAFIRQQQMLEPFGMDNPKPLYVFKDVTPTDVSIFGKTKEHTKLMFDTTGLAREAICFFKKPEDFSSPPQAREVVTLLAHVEQSYFMGRQQTRLRIVDIV